MTLLDMIDKAVKFAVVGDDERLSKMIETCEDALLQPEEKTQLLRIVRHVGELRDRIVELEYDVEDPEDPEFNQMSRIL